MKIEADVLGVEQAMDFNTMEQSAFVVLNIFGTTVRVPITEDQMETITVAALTEKRSSVGQEPDGANLNGDVFPETRAVTPGGARQQVQEEVQERDFSVMTELTDHGNARSIDDEDTGDGGVMELFAPSTEETQRIAQLRGRPQLGRSEPAPVQHSPGLPQMPGLGMASDDDGIQQG